MKFIKHHLLSQFQFFFLLIILLFILAGIGINQWLMVPQHASSSMATTINMPITMTPFPRQLHYATGETLTILKPPQRIISQTLATDEILLAICPIERIAAVSTLALDKKYSNVSEQARQVPQHITSNIEPILSLNPDLIFVASYSRAETIELLQTSKAPILRLTHFHQIEDIKNNIRIIGYAIGEEQRAAELIIQMEQEIQAILAQLPTLTQPLRVMLYTPSSYTAGRHTTFDNMINLIGAINVAAEQGIEQYAKISEEQILAWQPQYIVTHAYTGEFSKVYQQLLSNPAIAASEAGNMGRIIIIDERYFGSVSQYIVKAIKSLADNLYLNTRHSDLNT